MQSQKKKGKKETKETPNPTKLQNSNSRVQIQKREWQLKEVMVVAIIL